MPELPEGVEPDQLSSAIKRELRSLAKNTAETVAGQLVAAGVLLEVDPDQALVHARVARRLASRVASVREAAGLAAYAAGQFSEALAELRAHRRMTGSIEHVAIVADCERALGRPDKALAEIAETRFGDLPAQTRVEVLLVRSGAHRDLQQPQEALAVLEIGELDSPVVKPWTPRLWYGYAEALLAVGRTDEAADWFRAVAAIDDAATDAQARAAEISGELDESDGTEEALDFDIADRP